MKINFTTASPAIYYLDTVAPLHPWPTLLHELQQLLWQQEPTIGDQDHFAVSCLGTHTITYNSALHKFQQHFVADTFKQQVLDQLFDNEEFMMQWANPERKYVNDITVLSVNWVATPPRYRNHPWHVDSRCQIAHGMIYITEQDNALHSTWFDTGRNGHLLRIPSAPGQGWMVVNTDQARHCAMNDTDRTRYSLKFSLELKVRKF
jgi:hypothetical protein